MPTYTDLAAARAAVETGIAESVGDNPDLTGDMIAADIIEAVAYECDPDTARELCRTELGYVPSSLRRWLGAHDWVV